MPPTIKDIAKKAGVSHATVSRALNGNPAIPECTASAIRDLANELGYLPSAAARGLKTKRSKVIGVIVSRIDNPYFGEIVQGIEDVLQPAGFSLFFSSSHLNSEIEKDIIQAFAEHRVEGVIICSVTVSRQQADRLKAYGMPIVVINNQSPEEYQCSIAHDDVYGSRKITEYLLSLGHKRIAYLGNENAERINQDRLKGFREAMKVSGTAVDESLIVACGGGEIQNGVEGMQNLLRSGTPDAVFCFNDLMAIGALKVLADQGIQVPAQVSVAGFDNIQYSAFSNPALTTFDQPKRAIGSEAAQTLLDLVKNPQIQTSTLISRVMQGEILIRASTAACARQEVQ